MKVGGQQNMDSTWLSKSPKSYTLLDTHATYHVFVPFLLTFEWNHLRVYFVRYSVCLFSQLYKFEEFQVALGLETFRKLYMKKKNTTLKTPRKANTANPPHCHRPSRRPCRLCAKSCSAGPLCTEPGVFARVNYLISLIFSSLFTTPIQSAFFISSSQCCNGIL